MKMKDAIDFLDKQISDPSQGLPEEVFLFLSRMTPIVNVDLLIKDEKGRTLLSWRDDIHSGTGWHVQCFLSGKFKPSNTNLKSNDNGYLKWHNTCPKNLIKYHEIYRSYI